MIKFCSYPRALS